MNRRDILSFFGIGAALPAVESVQALKLEPDDAIVLKFKNRHVSQADLAIAKDLMESKFPGRTVLILDADVDIQVLKQK